MVKPARRLSRCVRQFIGYWRDETGPYLAARQRQRTAKLYPALKPTSCGDTLGMTDWRSYEGARDSVKSKVTGRASRARRRSIDFQVATACGNVSVKQAGLGIL